MVLSLLAFWLYLKLTFKSLLYPASSGIADFKLNARPVLLIFSTCLALLLAMREELKVRLCRHYSVAHAHGQGAPGTHPGNTAISIKQFARKYN